MKEYQVIKLFSEELQKEKRIYIYLPRSYRSSDKRYPVLYMHDGHNLFDEKTAFAGTTWGIIESYNDFPKLPELIIVGIEADEERGEELIPYEFTYKDGSKSGGKANLYLDFIAKTLKPYIDNRFRSFKSPKNTALMGSSFGGVNSTYAACTYQDTFTRFGCLSNAYYYGGFKNKLIKLLQESSLEHVKKFYMDFGTQETDDAYVNQQYMDSNKEVAEIVSKKIDASKFRFAIIEDGRHHEKDWAKRFPQIIQFLFND